MNDLVERLKFFQTLGNFVVVSYRLRLPSEKLGRVVFASKSGFLGIWRACCFRPKTTSATRVDHMVSRDLRD